MFNMNKFIEDIISIRLLIYSLASDTLRNPYIDNEFIIFYSNASLNTSAGTSTLMTSLHCFQLCNNVKIEIADVLFPIRVLECLQSLVNQ